MRPDVRNSVCLINQSGIVSGVSSDHDAGAQCTDGFQGPEHEAAEAASDVHEALPRGQPDLAGHMVDLVALCLLQAGGAIAPVAAGVHLERLVEPEAVERLAQAVMRPRIDLCLARVAVGGAPLHQVVFDAVDGVEPQVEARAHGGGHGDTQVPLQVDLLVEIALQQSEMPAREGGHQRAIGAKHQRESRFALTGAVLLATRQGYAERDTGAFAQRVDDGLQRKFHEDSPAIVGRSMRHFVRDAPPQLGRADTGEVEIVGARQQLGGGRTEFRLQLPQKRAGRKHREGAVAAGQRLALEKLGQLAREPLMFLLLDIGARLVRRAAEAAIGTFVAGPVIHQVTDLDAALRMDEAFQLGDAGAALLLQQACAGGVGNEDPVRFHLSFR